jgi:hypothetical protein
VFDVLKLESIAISVSKECNGEPYYWKSSITISVENVVEISFKNVKEGFADESSKPRRALKE